jgi:hypothetical protein
VAAGVAASSSLIDLWRLRHHSDQSRTQKKTSQPVDAGATNELMSSRLNRMEEWCSELS